MTGPLQIIAHLLSPRVHRLGMAGFEHSKDSRLDTLLVGGAHGLGDGGGGVTLVEAEAEVWYVSWPLSGEIFGSMSPSFDIHGSILQYAIMPSLVPAS